MKKTLSISMIFAITLGSVILFQCGESEIDVTPPTVPTGVRARPADSIYGVHVQWIASTDDTAVAGYNVYRDGAYRDMSIGTSYLDAAVTEGNTYCYRVAAYDREGNTSAQSAEACVDFNTN